MKRADVCFFFQIMENLEHVHWVIDEMIVNGHIVETNKALALAPAQTIDKASR